MTRALFVCEGSSDSGLASLLGRVATDRGYSIQVTAPDLSRLPFPVGHRAVDKIEASLRLGGSYEVIAVHRDANSAGYEARRTEIENAVQQCSPHSIPLPVVPVRMTEAWLLVDEALIRRVAGNPNGNMPLNLPTWSEAENMADPKSELRRCLATAAELSGRRRTKVFQSRFGAQRRSLLEHLNPSSDIRLMTSWRQFIDTTATVLERSR